MSFLGIFKNATKFYKNNGWQLLHTIDLLRSLVERDMKILYKRSVLGVAWTLINPLLQLAVFIFVFQVVLPVDVPKYSSFVFVGLLIWTWFQNSLLQATDVIIANRPLIRQPGFSKAILPVVIVTTGLIHFTLALPVLIIFLLFDGVQLQAVAFLLPILQSLQFIFTLSFAYFLAAINVIFRDTQHTLGVILQLLFYLTPIFYSIDNIPDSYRVLYSLNPMVSIVMAYRDILIDGVQPNWQSLFLILVYTAVILPIGVFFFKRQSIFFIEEL